MSWFSSFVDKIFDPGKKDREAANATYQSSVAGQAASEKYWKDLVNKMLYGNGFNQETGEINSQPGQGGAIERAQTWEDKFFNYLDTAPDLTYNAQRGTFERSIKEAENSMKSNLNARGLSNSVLGVSRLGNLMGTRAQGLASLEGQRQDRRGQNIQAGTSMASSILDRALNLGKAGTFGTQVPQLQQGYAGYLSNQANAAGGGIGQDLLAEGTRNIMDNMFRKTTVAAPPAQSAGGIGQNVLMRFVTGGLFG